MNRDVFQLNADLEESHWWFTARRKIIQDVIVGITGSDRSRLVVDVGCGTGGNIASLASKFDVVGIDVAEDAIEFARARFPDVEFHCGDSTAFLAGAPSRPMIILLNDVLEHIEDAYPFFRATFDQTPVGSYFVITVPADPKLWSSHDVSHGHFRRYTVDTLREHWTGLPADELLFTFYNARLYPVVKLLRWISNRRGTSLGKADTDLSLPPRFLNRALYSVFAGESRRLRRVLAGRSSGYVRGVSLIAVLEKTA